MSRKIFTRWARRENWGDTHYMTWRPFLAYDWLISHSCRHNSPALPNLPSPYPCHTTTSNPTIIILRLKAHTTYSLSLSLNNHDHYLILSITLLLLHLSPQPPPLYVFAPFSGSVSLLPLTFQWCQVKKNSNILWHVPFTPLVYSLFSTYFLQKNFIYLRSIVVFL